MSLQLNKYPNETSNILSDRYKNTLFTAQLSSHLKDNGFVKLEGLFSEVFFEELQNEAHHLSTISIERNFTMPGYETPRKLSVLGGRKIFKNSQIFPDLYKNQELLSVISSIVSQPVFKVNHEEECMVINYLEKSGNTHGWHLDDPTFALVVILRTPPSIDGGYIEIVPDWKKYCESRGFDYFKDTNTAIEAAREENKVREIHLNIGDCYLLNAGECIHRVVPIKGDLNRTALNFAYDHRENFEFGSTADILYGESNLVLEEENG